MAPNSPIARRVTFVRPKAWTCDVCALRNRSGLNLSTGWPSMLAAEQLNS